MNAQEFLARGQPTKRQSKLAPFRADLMTLQRAKLTLERMIEFLSLNNVSASKSTIAKFLKQCETGKFDDLPSRVTKSAPNKRIAQTVSPSESVDGSHVEHATAPRDTQDSAQTGVDPLPDDWMTADLTPAQIRLLTPTQRRSRTQARTAQYFPNRFQPSPVTESQDLVKREKRTVL